ncbi:MAG: ParA family protein [Oscillospiraceae bacterium]|nr:ParA family protein [Oscillospiraceae bacterium]
MKSIAIYNNKGGVGKTSAAINLAYAFAKEQHQKVLLVDCDGQCNSSNFFCTSDAPQNLYSVLASGNEPVFYPTRYPDIDILVSSPGVDRLTGIKVENVALINRKAVELGYDIVIFDLPPAMSEFVEYFLVVSDVTIVPIEASSFSLQGLQRVTDTIRAAGANFGGCFLSKYEKDNTTDIALLEVIRATLNGDLMKTIIPYSKTIKNSIAYKLAAAEYRGWTRTGRVYNKLAAELIERI